MTELIDVLPGIKLPVGAVSEELSKMWGGNKENALSEFRASQMNLVLHFGRTVSPDEAKARFEIAVRFAQRFSPVLLYSVRFLKIISRCRLNYSANVLLEIPIVKCAVVRH